MTETLSKRNLRIEDCAKDNEKETLEAVNAKKDDLKAKKDALQSALNAKLAELRALCLREGELTGELPPETPLGQREPVPQIRKRVRTESTTTAESISTVNSRIPTPTTTSVPSRASNHSSSSSSLSHSSVASNKSTFSNTSQTSSLPPKKTWVETSIDDSAVSRKKKVSRRKNIVDCCDEVDRCVPVVKPLPQPAVQSASQPLQVHVQQQVQIPVKVEPQHQSVAAANPSVAVQLRPVSRQSRQSSRPSSRASSRPSSRASSRPQSPLDIIREEIPIRENRRNMTTPRPVSIPLSPILPKPGSGVEVNVLSVGHFQPYWEETKPYELSDFYKYSAKHRKKLENIETSESQETSRKIIETKTKTITTTITTSSGQQNVSVPAALSPEPKQNNTSFFSDSFLVKSAVAADFHDEMYEWYETTAKTATLV